MDKGKKKNGKGGTTRIPLDYFLVPGKKRKEAKLPSPTRCRARKKGMGGGWWGGWGRGGRKGVSLSLTLLCWDGGGGDEGERGREKG